jgi:hypothetical protein
VEKKHRFDEGSVDCCVLLYGRNLGIIKGIPLHPSAIPMESPCVASETDVFPLQTTNVTSEFPS